jgi:hypothetical protein
MVMPQCPQQIEIYLAADEQQADEESASSQHGIRRKQCEFLAPASCAVATMAVFTPKPIEPPAIWNM